MPTYKVLVELWFDVEADGEEDANMAAEERLDEIAELLNDATGFSETGYIISRIEKRNE